MNKFLKPGIFILSLIPFLVIISKIYFNQLGPEPVKEITHHTGEWTLIFICLTLAMSPLKRMMLDDEIIGPIELLLTEKGSYINGTNLMVDGGWTAW